MVLGRSPHIERLARRRDFKRLVRALEYDRDEALQRGAADALIGMGPESAIEALLAMTRRNWAPERARVLAAEVLARAGDARGLQALLLMSEPESEYSMVRRGVERLGEAGDPQAIRVLEALFQADVPLRVLGTVARALERLWTPDLERIRTAYRRRQQLQPYSLAIEGSARSHSHVPYFTCYVCHATVSVDLSRKPVQCPCGWSEFVLSPGLSCDKIEGRSLPWDMAASKARYHAWQTRWLCGCGKINVNRARRCSACGRWRFGASWFGG